ncbi:MAG: preprotein translocase subunit YajC [Gammaproteobacteria bacterium]
MDFLISTAHAQAAGAAQQPSLLMSFGPLVLIFVVFYFLPIRPQAKKAKEHREMVAKLQSGDEVITAGGLAGKVVEAGETFVTLEISKDVAVKVQRFQVTQVLPKGSLKG